MRKKITNFPFGWGWGHASRFPAGLTSFWPKSIINYGSPYSDVSYVTQSCKNTQCDYICHGFWENHKHIEIAVNLPIRITLKINLYILI